MPCSTSVAIVANLILFASPTAQMLKLGVGISGEEHSRNALLKEI
jgi:hypothetical protein